MAGIQVLHVDDEPDMRLLVKLSLDRDDGIMTRSAASGLEALDATTDWRPDVILLDAVMPGMDGIATMRALQANPRTAGIPVLFLTGKCTDGDIDAFKTSGSAGVIAKPFNPQALAAAIRDYVRATAVMPSGTEASSAGPAMPDFLGQAGAVRVETDGGMAVPVGGAGALGALATTTQALLLDGSGAGFALTITERADGPGGGIPLLTVDVAPLKATTVSDILGQDVLALLSVGDPHAAVTDATPIQGATFAIDHAIGCSPAGHADNLLSVDRQSADIGALRHLGSISPAGDWAALVLPRAVMH